MSARKKAVNSPWPAGMPVGAVWFWFRRDLRWHDHEGLARAMQVADELRAPLVPVFLFDPGILDALEDDDDARVAFLHRTVAAMKTAARAAGGDLFALRMAPLAFWTKVRDDAKPAALVFARDYEEAALTRDDAVKALFAKTGARVETVRDHLIFEKDEIRTLSGGPFSVYTPYRRAWEKRALDEPRRFASVDCGGVFARWPRGADAGSVPSLDDLGFRPPSIPVPERAPPAGEREVALAYGARRDLLALERATTRWGLFLRFGTLSVREAFAASSASETLRGELIWREFFAQVLWRRPDSARRSYKEIGERIAWRNDDAEIDAWKAGRTGYPLVDAGMRELAATGFMHNRARMVAASFLTKHLLAHWKIGERHFARLLFDYDLASNAGNWQWAAGTGCDAAPYFRVFNPERQAERFDPDGVYVRRWVPEVGTPMVPAPIVDHAVARDRVLAAWRAAGAAPEAG